MTAISYERHRFLVEVIRHAVWLYFRFTLSFSAVEKLLARRGVEARYEITRCWISKFGPQIAKNLNRRKSSPPPRGHLDEMTCKIGGEPMYLWRAVDDGGAVLDLVVQKRRDAGAALKHLKRLFRNKGGYEKMTALRIRIFRYGGGKERCLGSSPEYQLSDS